MLNNFPLIVKTEKVHCYVLLVTWPYLVSVKSYQITLSNGTYKFNAFSGIVPGHFAEVIDEGLLTIGDQWVVLYVFCPYILFDCFRWISQVGCTIECNSVLLVRLQIVVHSSPPILKVSKHLSINNNIRSRFFKSIDIRFQEFFTTASASGSKGFVRIAKEKRYP